MNKVFERNEVVALTPSRLSWTAVFSGAVLSVGLWILFHVIGLAAGLTAIDPNSPSSLRAAGIGTGVWSAIASLLALFAGGVLAGRMAGPVNQVDGGLHGAVLWATTTVVGLFLILSAAGMILQGAARVGGTVVGAASEFGSLADNADPMQALGLDSKDLLAPLNRQLQEQGKPTVTVEQLRAAVQATAKTAVQQGHLDRAVLLSAIERNTSLSRAEVEDVANQVEQRMSALGERAKRVQTGALQAAEDTGKGLWWVFGAMLLGLFAAVGGAILGAASSTQRRNITHVSELHRAEVMLGPPAEVHT